MNNSPPTAPNNNAPVQLGHYQLRDCIGRGGMGLVYRARDTRLERDVAIKCLRTELFEAHYIERFKREALLLAKLNHPNIVQIYDFIEAPEQVALVMELVDGQNLHTYLREHIVPIAQRLQWLSQISEGLAIAHDAGIIHRDLKTENILINKRGQAKITDLGIAKSQDFNATLTDHVAGSYCSMSPEQAMGEAITFKSDLFSLGILAYQLLCGAHPFGDTNNKLQTMQRIIAHPPTAPQQHNPDLPAEFIDLLGQLLSKDPDKRPDNTHWVAAQFATLRELNWRDDSPGDDTLALAMPQPTNSKATRTQDHPTFDTRFMLASSTKHSVWHTVKNYVTANKIAVSSAAISLLIIAGIIVWQLQPKPPKYVAVIPPKLTAEGMQESQQELVKGAVYDAIQQGIIQLNGYYLIPNDEIADIEGDDEAVHRATAADELINTDIKCKIESCSIRLTRLTSDHNKMTSRLKVENTKTLDVLTDNYLSVAEIVLTNIGRFYSKKITNSFKEVDDQQYADFLNANRILREQGASESILATLEQFQASTKRLAAVQTLYREAALDLYHETKKREYLTRLETFLNYGAENKDDTTYLKNLYSLQIAQQHFDAAFETTQKLNISASAIHELNAHTMMAKGDYEASIAFFKNAIASKKTANNLFNIGNVYWYSGNLALAKQYIQEALALSPSLHKAHTVYGLIALLEGDIASATKSFENVIAQKPNDITSLSNLGLCYLLTEKFAEAKQLFGRAYALAPNFNTLLLNIGDAENLAGNKIKADEIYLTLINTINDENITAEGLRTRSQAYAHIGKFAEALTDLQKLEKIDSQNIETTYTAALVHTLAQNKTSAILNIKNSIKNGMHKMWFQFSWFDTLCSDNDFVQLMKIEGKSNRCPLNP